MITNFICTVANNNDSKSLSDIFAKYRSRTVNPLLENTRQEPVSQEHQECAQTNIQGLEISLCTNVCQLRVVVKTNAKTKDVGHRSSPRTHITGRKPTTYTRVRVSVHVAITDYPISVFYVRSTYWIFLANTAANYER